MTVKLAIPLAIPPFPPLPLLHNEQFVTNARFLPYVHIRESVDSLSSDGADTAIYVILKQTPQTWSQRHYKHPAIVFEWFYNHRESQIARKYCGRQVSKNRVVAEMPFLLSSQLCNSKTV